MDGRVERIELQQARVERLYSVVLGSRIKAHHFNTITKEENKEERESEMCLDGK